MKGKIRVKGVKVFVVLMLALAMLLSSCAQKTDNCSAPKYGTTIRKGG